MSEDAPEDDTKRRSLGKRLTVLGRKDVGAGVTFGVVIAVFTLGGHWLDSAIGTSPAFLLIGLFAGGAGGFVHLVETVAPGTLFKSRKKPQK